MRIITLSALITLFTLSGCTGDGLASLLALDLKSVSWKEQASHSEASLRGLCVVDAGTAWVSGSGGTVLRTIDGGRTWLPRPIAHPVGAELDYRDVHAFDDDHALVMSAGLPARIYMTVDGGLAWTQVYANDTEGVFFDAMAFWDETHGIAFSDPVAGTLLIIITSDGGRTWSEINAASIPGALDGEAGFAGSGTCLAVATDGSGARHVFIGLGGATGAAPGSNGARVFHSPDQGRTWEVVVSPLKSSGSSGVFSLAFSDALNGVMVGGDYLEPDDTSSNAAYTTDGGRSWSLVGQGAGPRGYRSVVCYLPREGAFIAGGPTGTDYSLDGGRTWSTLGDEGFHVIACSSDGVAVWAAGADGRIAKLAAKSEFESSR